MPKYKLIGGTHSHGGKTWKKGDTLELTEEQAKKLRGKLALVEGAGNGGGEFQAPKQPAKGAKASPSTKDAAAGQGKEGQADANFDASELGEEVTQDFDGATDAGLRVFKNGGWYHVTKTDGGEAAGRAMREAEAREFIDSYEG